MRAFCVLAVMISVSSALRLQIKVDTHDVIHTTDPLSPSVAMGLGIFERRWVDYFRDPKFLTLARALGPSFLRVGGTKADVTTFQPNNDGDAHENGRMCIATPRQAATFERHRLWADEQLLLYDLRKRRLGVKRVISPISFNESDWLKLNEFCTCVGWKLIFDLNLLKRTGDQWNSSNARQLIHFSENRFHVNWELGNEPNSYPHKMGIDLTPEQVGEGFNELRRILRTSSWWESSLLVGPDINRAGKFSTAEFLMRFLQTASQSMSKITFHHYYMNGRTATVDDFTNPKTLGGLAKQIQQMVDVQQQWAPGTSVWIGETASAYGGGAKGISNSYVDGVTWLDKLGMSSKMGVDMVIRQTFLESNYALIDTNFDPLPDYWLTLLYKRLVGNKVLNATASKCRKGQCFAFGKGSVRIYAHCAKEKFKRGSVVLYFINLWPRRLHLSFNLPENSVGYMYLLKPGESGNLTSTSVRLNGKVLRLTSSNSIPPLPPKRIEQSKLRRALSVPSLTFGFLVLEGVNARACMDGK